MNDDHACHIISNTTDALTLGICIQVSIAFFLYSYYNNSSYLKNYFFPEMLHTLYIN